MKILVTGSNGLLGQKIVAQLVRSRISFLATSLGENRNSKCPAQYFKSLDITDADNIASVFNFFKPTVVINTAAMTNVDACEADPENCEKINVTAVEFLFAACKKSESHFIHLSTDFVFDGENGPYRETDKRNPLSVYAQSKVDSEDVLLRDNYTNWSTLRTIIVFGRGENLSRSNIVLWAKEALQSGKPLNIVNDQFRAPTWADDLAWACIQTAKMSKNGIYHISGPETFSIYDLVVRIANFHNWKMDQITPVSSSTLNQKAKRPPKTGFIIEKARKELGYDPLKFEESLAKLMD